MTHSNGQSLLTYSIAPGRPADYFPNQLDNPFQNLIYGSIKILETSILANNTGNAVSYLDQIIDSLTFTS